MSQHKTPPLPLSKPSAPSTEVMKFNKGLMHQSKNQLDLAEKSYLEVLAANPSHGKALCMLGLLAHAQGRMDDALTHLSRSVDAEPDYANAHLHRGDVFKSMGQAEQALSCFEQALIKKPDYLEAFISKSQTLKSLGHHEEALKSDQQALALDPTSPQARVNLSDTLIRMKRRKEALFQLEVATADNPDYVDAFVRKGVLLYEMGQIFDALSTFERGIALNDRIAKLHVGRGLTLTLMARLEEALVNFKLALELAPNEAETHSNIGVLYQRMGDEKSAIHHFRAAITLRPEYAEAHQNLAFSLLRTNETEEALDEFEWRWRMPGQTNSMRTYAKPVWDGVADLSDKTLMLWTEQGPQDVTIWASRLAPIIARTKHCLVYTYPKLVSLYKRSFPDADVRADRPDYDKSQNDFDYHLPMGNLFKYTRPDLDQKQHQEAYLIADAGRVKYWKQRLAEIGPPPYVGISWKGALVTDVRSANYTEVESWAPLIQKPATFINLQCGESASELGDFEKQHGVKVHNFEDLDLFDNLDDVAALASALDVAISVSTCVSALTAGVGTPTWILAWKQSPWNTFLLRSRGPNVTHFERNSNETWQSCFETMAERLQTVIDR